MEFVLSEWGEHTMFKSFEKAIKHLQKNNLIGTENFLLWIKGSSRKEMEEWKKAHKNTFDEESMRLVYSDTKKKEWIWCSAFKKWYDKEKYFSDEELD